MGNIIIIKTGQYETFVPDAGESFSLGDVLRTTALFRALDKKIKVQWFTHLKAMPLLPITENLKVSEFNLSTLNSIEKNDAVLIINLEKDPKLIPFLQNKNNVVGFLFVNNQWHIKDYLNNLYTLESWINHCNTNAVYTWSAMLHKLLGLVLAVAVPIYKKPEVEITADIGLNWHVGNKWPSKKIGDHLWKKLESDLQSKYRVSWQKGLDSTHEYASWIASNRLIISVDSLGLHLANAMNIPLIGLFGSTDYKLHDAGPHSYYVTFDAPKAVYSCIPCWKSDCFQKTHCSEHLDFNKIYAAVERLLN